MVRVNYAFHTSETIETLTDIKLFTSAEVLFHCYNITGYDKKLIDKKSLQVFFPENSKFCHGPLIIALLSALLR